MTVETTLQKMFDEYPDIFATKRDCYDHLFCTIGNGYEWKRGQIVSCSDNNVPEDEIVKREEEDYAAECHTPARQSEENLNRMMAMRNNWIKLGFATDADFRKWYPISEYSLIKNVPDDVRSDWAKAVEECRQMLKNDGIDPEVVQ